jgi:hypothetical protein
MIQSGALCAAAAGAAAAMNGFKFSHELLMESIIGSWLNWS